MTGGEARDRVEALREAGAALRERPVGEIVASLAAACARFADPSDGARAEAVAALADHYGVPETAVEPIFAAAFPRWDRSAIEGWLESDLAAPGALDGWVEIGGALRRARGPRLLLMIQALGVPTTPIVDLMAALLVKAPAWIKPATGADDLAIRFATVLGEVDPILADAVVVAGWERDSPAAREVMGAADVISATGGAGAVEAIRREAGPDARVVLHGPRLSAAAIGESPLEADREAAVAALADDVALAGQIGCLSPVVAWVEAPPAEVHALAEPVRDALAERWPASPRREASTAERSAWAEWTALAAVESAAGTGGPTAGGVDSAWTVRTRSGAGSPDPPPVPRALVLEPVDSLEAIAALCARRRGMVATVGVRAAAGRLESLAPRLAEAGVERIASLGAMQRPPLAWRRDGRPGIADLVEWTDWEREA